MEVFPDPRFEAARKQGSLSVQDLWVRYLTLGGHCDIFDIDAHLKGVLALAPFERDALACALNERLDELADAGRISYAKGRPCPDNTLEAAIAELLDEGPDLPSGPPPFQDGPE